MGDRIEAERKALDWSQQQLVDRVRALGGELSQGGLDKLEKRGSRMSKASSHIARALNVNHDWLLTGKGPKDLDKSIDRKLELIPPDDFDDVYDLLEAIVDQQLAKRSIPQ